MRLLRSLFLQWVIANGVYAQRRYRFPGLPLIQRVCTTIPGLALSATVCASGADAARANIIDYCNNNANSYDLERCFYAQVGRAGYHTLFASAAGIAVMYIFGFDFGIGRINEIANQMNLQRREADLLPPLNDYVIGSLNQSPFIPPMNKSLPTLTFDDVAKNLSYPFIFHHAGLSSTYLPPGHAIDPTLLFQYPLAGYNASSGHAPIMHKRFADPESLGLQKVEVRKPDGSVTCQGNIQNLPYLDNYSIHCNPNYGWKMERVSVCGHPDRSTQIQYQLDITNIYNKALDYTNSMGKAVMEIEIHNSQTGFTMSSVRSILETQQASECFEGEHIDAYCSHP